MSTPHVLIVGAGVFGISSSLELRARGYNVTVVDPGPLPHPRSASYDLSKLIRVDYADDLVYTHMMMEAFPVWREWNRKWGQELYHETGILCASKTPLQPGGFEYESYKTLTSLGFPLRRLGGSVEALEESRRRFPLMSHAHVDGYYNPIDGWAESGKVMAKLIEEAKEKGVNVITGIRCKSLITEKCPSNPKNTIVKGITTDTGLSLLADRVILAAGSWSISILPELREILHASGQPVLIWKPDRPDLFRGAHFLPYASDIATTGWYGFPLTEDGYLKVGLHGAGYWADPSKLAEVPNIETHRKQWEKFFHEIFPKDVADGIHFAYSRLCYYCDSFDGDFLIDHHPKITNLVVATGDSGHGFKFAPVIGSVVADVLEKKPNRYSPRFVWRTPKPDVQSLEASRKSNDKPFPLPSDVPTAKL